MLTNQFGEQYLYAVNRDMFQRESAWERIEREFGKLLAREDSLIIFVGSDSGNIIRYILDRGLPAGTRYIFLEPSEILSQVVTTVDLSLAEDRISLVDSEQFVEASQNAGIVNYLYVDGVFLKRSLSAEYGFVGQYRSEYWDASSYINELRWNSLVSLGQDAFVQRQLQNCADNENPISDIKGCLKGRTVIILGGGPSLDEHLDWIKSRREQLVVFAVSRIAGRLMQVGLEPDFVFSVDPHDISYQVSKDMLKLGPGTVFINQYHVSPRLLSQWPHRKYFMGPLLPWESELNPKCLFNGSGPTVTNSAIAAAAWLGSQHILLAGVDLCFTPEGYTHAKGSRERAAGPKTDLSSLVLETNGGQQACTTPDFASAARNIAQQAKTLTEKGVRVVNISSGAARIEGVQFQSPTELELNLSLLVDRLHLPQPKQGNKRQWLRSLEQDLSEAQNKIVEVLVLLEKAQEHHNDMYEGEYINPQRKLQLEGLDKKLSEEYPELFKMVKTLSVRALLRMAQTFTDDDELQLEQIKQRLETYYTALEEGAKRLQQYIEAGLESVRIRLREQSLLNESIEEQQALALKWIERNEPGRAFCLAPADKGEDPFVKARQAYEEELHRDSLQALAQQSQASNLHALPARVQYLKDKKDIETLQLLYESLSATEGAIDYLPLIAATLYQMEDKSEAALAELIPVMDLPGSPIIEQALAMMVGLCSELGYHQAVMDAMAGLASINAFYLGLYADALMANGQASDAVEHLTEYLHYFPGDRQALAKLKRWYKELGNSEGVRLVETLLDVQGSDQS